MAGPIVIAGGSGFLGISLAHHLSAAGHNITILSRRAPKVTGPWKHIAWDGRTMSGDWGHVLDGAAGVVNLAGRSVDCIKTPEHQDEILRSRVESTRVLGEAMREVDAPPTVWVQMSTAHIYGDPPSAICDEDSALGVGLAQTVGRAWEAAFDDAKLPGQRGVVLRTSFVIGRDRGAGGGAMSRFKVLVRFGLGGTVGTGRQGLSWIHEADMNALFERALTNDSMQGVYIASSPNPVSQREFMRTLRRVMGMPIGLPSFARMVRIGAPLLMRTDPELALYGRYVVSKRLAEEGYSWRHAELAGALREVLTG